MEKRCALGGHAEAVVDVDDEVDGLERLAHFRGHLPAARRVRAVDLGQQGREHRRPGRDLDDLDRAVRRQRHVREPLADVERDRVADARAFALRLQIDREIAHLRLRAQIIVAHEAVEIERRGGSRIGLDRRQFGQVLQPVRRGLQDAIRLLERRALRQIDDDLDLGLVVERQQFHHDVFGHEQRADRDGGETDGDQENLRAHPAFQERRRDADVEAPHRADVVAVVLAVLRLLEALSGEAHQEPGRHGHRDEEREQHRDRRVGRDRAHVRAHQAADEHHRQQRRDDGERRDDGRIADLGHRLDRGLDEAALAARRPVPDDVLDDDDRVVDENADREDEREQAHPIDGVAHHPGGEEGQEDRRRDDDQDHHALAPADRRRDENDDRDRRQRKVEQEFVRLLVGRLAVVARDRDLEAGRHDAALDRLQPLHHVFGDADSVLALALGDREADGGPALESAGGAARHRPGALVDFGRADDDIGDVLDIDRAAVARGQQQEADVGNALQRLPGDHRDRLVVARGTLRRGRNGWRWRACRSAGRA